MVVVGRRGERECPHSRLIISDLLHSSFSDCSLIWDWPCDYAMDASEFDPIPLQCLPPDPLPPCPDLLQEFYTAFDCENGLCGSSGDVDPGGEKGVALVAHGEAENDCEERKEEMVSEGCSGGGGEREEIRAITFDDVSRYFYVPITQAAKELNVGLTQLKKKCRELGIPRWPHRKMKSLQALIKNVQELGRDDGEMGESQLRQAIEILERERETMERVPGTQLEDRTKRLRQACFKANFKKRRLGMADGADRPPATMAAAAARTMVKQQEKDEEEVMMGRFLLQSTPAGAATACRKNTVVTVKHYADYGM
ncbi:hypothetical protein Taro_048359 [Colocasia esculenta]|uniref:RWP-RK domain-containing protein n=1 Tax=Colocasia esculenta TaxID=4460 RepID=A0A843X866_COLES|nr:hypothetical protein [Colocasia esculenta]